MMPPEAFFVDANVPMYAKGVEHPYKEPCAHVLVRLAQEDLPACTSAEVLQEILHRYLSLSRPEQARQMVEDLATLIPEVLPVTREDALHAARLSAEYPALAARDLLHLAVMFRNGITAILSADTHFDSVAEVRRIDPAEF